MRSSVRRARAALVLCLALGCVVLLSLASTAGAASLPDGRVYEMVTPPLNHDADVYATYGSREQSAGYTYRPMEAAADGERVTFIAAPTVGGNERGGNSAGNQYLASRLPDGGWVQEVLQPAEPTPIFQAFSPDLSHAVLDSHESLAPGAPGGPPGTFGFDDLYVTDTGASPTYAPFFTVAPPNRELERFLAAGVEGTGEAQLAYAGSSSDLSRLFFEANDALTANAEGGAESAFQAENNLYESSAGQLRLVNVLPDGSTEAGATFGGAPGSEHAPDFSGVVSSDGSRVFWTDTHAGPDQEHVFVREGGVDTVAVSAGAARYWTATPDGEHAFYSEGGGLYRFDVSAQQREQLAVPEAEVQGVIGASEAGDYVYFVGDGALAGSGGPAGQPTAGQPNLYLLHRGAGAWEAPVFIATLAAADDTLSPYSFKGGGDWRPGIGRRTAEVSPNGRGVAFMSSVNLTGVSYEAPQMFQYDAASHRLSCVSCAAGAAPTGEGRVPISLSDTYQPRFISEDGKRVFFESETALVPQDTNGRIDVYEWEEDGTGSCTQSEGCVYLLTGGTAPSESRLLDASATGDDVFVITRAQLVSQDENENYDLYDVRVGGAVPPAPPACSGTGCQGIPEPPPVFATPASVTFAGVGNFPSSTQQASVVSKKGHRAKHKPGRRHKRRRAKRRKAGGKHGTKGRSDKRHANRKAAR